MRPLGASEAALIGKTGVFLYTVPSPGCTVSAAGFSAPDRNACDDFINEYFSVQ